MIMKKNILFLGILAAIVTGCIKETYDMNKLSDEIHISPTFVIAGVKGDVIFSDLVKSSDTIVFDQDNFVKVIFKQDSIINLQLSDFYDFDNMVTFNKSYELGVLSIGSFQGSLSVSLDQITQKLPTLLRNQITALDDGSAHLFPPLPSVDLGEHAFTAFENFDNATFESGYLDITVTNNLTTPLSGLTLNLLNSSDRSFISTVSIPAVNPGQTQTSSVDLTDKRVTSTVIADVVLTGSPGTSTPVIISLDYSNISMTVGGRDLKVKSGRILIPAQQISSLDNVDTVSFDPGFGIELDEIRIASGYLSYIFKSATLLSASINLTLPTVIRNGSAVTHTITSGMNTQFEENIDFSGTLIDLGIDPLQPFNRIPLEYSIIVGSDGVLVNYNSTDKIELDLSLENPDFDYVKGYFGQESESIEPDTLDLDIDDILNRISGTFLISSPSIKLNYSNSFAIPLKIDFQATGKRGTDTVNLGLEPITIASPEYPASRDIASSILIDKINSDLPELISLPPGQVIFSGAATMNPEGNNELRDNYVFGNSRFLGSVEIEVPMEFRMSNLQFSDTIDNFLKVDDENSPVKPENFKKLELNLIAKNEFPLSVAVKMGLYNSETNTILNIIDASSLLGAAPVDANGKSTGEKETTTNLKLTTEFFNDIKNADQIIIWFTLNTSNNGTSDVKIYSDYKIQFRSSLLLRPEIIFN
ncbi:MAG TPA: hypothetical protein VMV47_17540 [Bacteroidales bacterium]|nr:hypothetical protein [Bacteroidales bacterium]